MVYDTTASSHFRVGDLPPNIRAEIKQLHQVRPFRNLILALFPMIWVGSVLACEQLPYVILRIIALLSIGISIQAMAIVMHEALHGNLFRNAQLDKWVGFAVAVPSFFSMAAYKVTHLNHHRYTRSEQDQDEISNWCNTQTQWVLLFYSWFLVGTVIYMFIVPVKALKVACPKDRRRIAFEYALMFCIYGLVISVAALTQHISWLLWYWLLPAQIAIVLSNVRGLAEHLGTRGKGDALERTRTITSNSFVSFLMLNLNYHLEHHLFPGIPWYNLPRVHRLLSPVYDTRHPAINDSYTAYALRSLREGPGKLS